MMHIPCAATHTALRGNLLVFHISLFITYTYMVLPELCLNLFAEVARQLREVLQMTPQMLQDPGIEC